MSKKIKFNTIDVLIVVALIAVIAVGAMFFKGMGNTVAISNNEVKVTAVVELSKREKAYTEDIKVGDLVMYGEKTKVATTVSAVEIVPAKDTGYDIIGGNAPRSEIPGEYDVRVSLTARGNETDRDILVDSVAIKVGEKVVISSKEWAGEGYVVGLEIEE